MRLAPWLALILALGLQAQGGAVHRFTLPNGLRVVHLEARGHPMVRLWLRLPFRPGDLPAGKAGLPELVLRMMDQGDAADLKAQDVDRLLEDAGVQVERTLAPSGITWRLLARNRDQDQALGLLADRILRPVLDPAHLEALRLACWQAYRTDAGLAARLRLPTAWRPTETTLGSLTLADVLAFRERVFRPERAILLLEGDLGLEQAKRLLVLSFGTWAPGPAERPALQPADPSAASPEPVLRLPRTEGTARAMAYAPRPEAVSPEAAALLALLLAEVPGLDLQPDGLLLVGPAQSGAAAPTKAEAALQAALALVRARTFRPAEVAKAKAAWTAAQSLIGLEPEARMTQALDQALGRAPVPARLDALSPGDLAASLAAWLQPAQVRVGVEGPTAALAAVP